MVIYRKKRSDKATEFIVKHYQNLTTHELYEILKTRSEIFVVEQNCVYQDLDDKDQNAIHVFCWNEEGRVAACLRVFMKDEAAGVAQIGRVVTLIHGKGLGGTILHKAVEIAREHYHANKIYLEAQQYAIGYYGKEGFIVTSEPFLEDGIPHVQMELELDRVTRIRKMEAIYDRVKAENEKAQRNVEAIQKDLVSLEAYYTSGLWKEDFAADEEGQLPADLKRGVLSEDGIYNLIEE